MQLLKKSHSGLRQLLLGRMTLALGLLLVQIFLLIAVFAWFEEYYLHYFGGSAVIAVWMVLRLHSKDMPADIRSAWLLIIMAAPVFGTLLYLFTQLEIGQRLLRRRVQTVTKVPTLKAPFDEDALERLKEEDPGAASMCRFAQRFGGGALYGNTDVTYYPVGEALLKGMLPELEKAEKFIYMEYFSVSEGTFWGTILEVLARKAAQGVDVRLIYDGTCEFMLLPKGYAHKLKELGISCKVFSPVVPIVSTHYNFRDHRKIMIIDGKTAFTGGINLCDEYINIGSRFGHWKDTAVMLKGAAVVSFTAMFLQMWNLDERMPDACGMGTSGAVAGAMGYVMPFGENPLDEIRVGQSIYMDMIQRATRSVCIMTPYLILDEQMISALRYASARGVQVRLLLPGIPDKYVPYALAKTHYRDLLKAGVEIYEYTPGFVHAKVVVADGKEAVVGTINFDYRSFYHHFECGAYLYGCGAIREILRDFEDCVARSRAVSEDTVRKEKWHMRLTGFLLKIFAPLL